MRAAATGLPVSNTPLPWRVALPPAWLLSVATWYVCASQWDTVQGENFASLRWQQLAYYLLPLLAFALGIAGVYRLRIPIHRWLLNRSRWLHWPLWLINIGFALIGFSIYPLLILLAFPIHELRMSTHIPGYTIAIVQHAPYDLDGTYYHTITVTRADSRTASWGLDLDERFCTQLGVTEVETRRYIRCDDEPITDRTLYIDPAERILYIGWEDHRRIDLDTVHEIEWQ